MLWYKESPFCTLRIWSPMPPLLTIIFILHLCIFLHYFNSVNSSSLDIFYISEDSILPAVHLTWQIWSFVKLSSFVLLNWYAKHVTLPFIPHAFLALLKIALRNHCSHKWGEEFQEVEWNVEEKFQVQHVHKIPPRQQHTTVPQMHKISVSWKQNKIKSPD